MQSLCLGTANFGENYGIANKSQVSKVEVDKILVWASNKVPELDTSSDYKGSHVALARHTSNFKVTSKINLNQLACPKEVRRRVNQISSDLCSEQIERILLRPHSAHSQFTIESLWELEKLSSIGVINEFGLSIYEPEELEYFAKYIKFPIVFQVPLNLFNRSFQKLLSSHESSYKRFKFYVRSIFLQGLLLMNPSDIPDQLKEAASPLSLLKQELSRIECSTIEATFSFIREQRWVEGVIVGVNNLDELKSNYEVFVRGRNIDCSFVEKLPDIPLRIQDPRRW